MASNHDSTYIQYLKRLFIKRYFNDIAKFICGEFPDKWEWLKFATFNRYEAQEYENGSDIPYVNGQRATTWSDEGSDVHIRFIESSNGKKLYEVDLATTEYKERTGNELLRSVYRAAATFFSLVDHDGYNTSNIVQSLRAIMIPGEANQMTPSKSVPEFDPLFKFLMLSFDKTECVYRGTNLSPKIDLHRYINRFSELLVNPALSTDDQWLRNVYQINSSDAPMPIPYVHLLRKIRNVFSAHNNPTQAHIEDLEQFTIFTGIAIVYFAQNTLGAKAKSVDISPMMIRAYVPEGYEIKDAIFADGAHLLMPYTKYTLRKIAGNRFDKAKTISFSSDLLSVKLDKKGKAERVFVYMPETETDRKVNEILGKILNKELKSKESINAEEIKKALLDAISQSHLDITETTKNYIDYLVNLFRSDTETATDTNKKVTRLSNYINEKDAKEKKAKRLRLILLSSAAVVLIAVISFGVYLRKTTSPLPYGWMVHAAVLVGNIDAPYIKACKEEDYARIMMVKFNNTTYSFSNFDDKTYLNNGELRDKIKSFSYWYKKAINLYTQAIETDSIANSKRLIRTALMYFTGKGGTTDYSLAYKYAKKASVIENQGLIALLAFFAGKDREAKDILEQLEFYNRPFDCYAKLCKAAIYLKEDSTGEHTEDSYKIFSEVIEQNDSGMDRDIALFLMSEIYRSGHFANDGKLVFSVVAQMNALQILLYRLHIPGILNLLEIFYNIDPGSPFTRFFLRLAWDLGATSNTAPTLQYLSNVGAMDIDDINDEVYKVCCELSSDSTKTLPLAEIMRKVHYGHKEEAIKAIADYMMTIDPKEYDLEGCKNLTSLFLSLGGGIEVGFDSESTLDSITLKSNNHYVDAIRYAKGYEFPKDSVKSDSLMYLAATEGLNDAKLALAKKILYSPFVKKNIRKKRNYEINFIGLKDGKKHTLKSGVFETALNTDNDRIYTALLDSAKTLIMGAAIAGNQEAQTLMAFITSQLGDKSFVQWHNKALERYDIHAVSYETLRHNPFFLDSTLCEKDITQIASALTLDHFTHKCLDVIMLIHLSNLFLNNNQQPGIESSYMLAETLMEYLRNRGTNMNDLFAPASHFYYFQFYKNLDKHRKAASSYFGQYYKHAFSKQLLSEEDRETFDSDGKISAILYDTENLYRFLKEVAPECELTIINQLGFDPFVNVRNKIDEPTTSIFMPKPSSEPYLPVFRSWEELYPLPEYDIYPF